MSKILTHEDSEHFNNNHNNQATDSIVERWSHSHLTTKLLKCREASIIKQENSRILHKALFKQEIRQKENEFSGQLIVLSNSIHSKNHELSLSKEHQNILVTKLSSTENELHEKIEEINDIRARVEYFTKSQSETIETITKLRRHISELQTRELELSLNLKKANENIRKKSRTIEILESDNTEISSSKDMQIIATNKMMEKMKKMGLEIEQYKKEEAERRQRAEKLQHLREIKKTAKRRSATMAETSKESEAMRKVASLLKNRDLHIQRLQQELQISENQRDLYRNMLRGKNICKLLNTNDDTDDFDNQMVISGCINEIMLPTIPVQQNMTYSRSSLHKKKKSRQALHQRKSIEDIMSSRHKISNDKGGCT